MLTDLHRALAVNQKIQLTVWDTRDDKLEFHYNSYIMDINIGLDVSLIKVAPPPGSQTKQVEPRMKDGIIVGAILEAYPNPYIFYPVIHGRQERPEPGFWLKIPDNPKIEVMQRRKHVRIPMVLPLEVEFQLGPKLISVNAFTEDMSGGGLRFTSARQFYVDQDLILRIRVDDGQELLKLNGKVVFSDENRVRRRPDDFYATACSFYDIDDRQEMLVMRECFRRELKKPV